MNKYEFFDSMNDSYSAAETAKNTPDMKDILAKIESRSRSGELIISMTFGQKEELVKMGFTVTEPISDSATGLNDPYRVSWKNRRGF